LVLFLGDTTCGAERDLGSRAVLLRLAISQPPISQKATYLYAFPASAAGTPACLREPGYGRARPVSRGNAPLLNPQAQALHLNQLQAAHAARAISNKADLPGLDDAPPRAWSTGSCRNMRANNPRQIRMFLGRAAVHIYASFRLAEGVVCASAAECESAAEPPYARQPGCQDDCLTCAPGRGDLCRADARKAGVEDQAIVLAGSRTVGFVDHGSAAAAAVLWCHGGPGSRVEPTHLGSQANAARLRVVGIDRPGYGLSTVQPGRTIRSWVPDAVAVADHLGIGQFVTAGTSTGGAYALALAALAPERVLGVVACCAMTDMRWPDGRATMSRPHADAVWTAPDRAAALAAAVDAHGKGGSKMRT